MVYVWKFNSINFMYIGSPDSSTKIVTNGLVLYLDASQLRSYDRSATTTWTNLISTVNNGTLTNTPTFNAANGGSFTFNGTDEYVDCGNNASLQINAGTISCWMKTTTNDATFRAVICKQSNYALFVRNAVLVTYDWGNNLERATATNVIDGNWKNIAMTFTNNLGTPSNNAVLYVNGSSVLTTTIKFSSDTVNLFLGYGNAAGQYLNGSIAGTLIYNRALSATEVLQNYNTTKTKFGL
jgi:hypothetical protein